MSDRPRTDPRTRHLPNLLAATFQQLSNSIAGGDGDRLPPLGTTDLEAEQFTPPGPEAVDPDAAFNESDAEEFTPEFTPQNLPDTTGLTSTFDFDTLPDASDGRFLRTNSGLLRFTRGVGEAPDNKANANHPAYRARAEFVSTALDFVTSNFDATSAGQHRSHDAPVTANRSANSDHFSGGAFDVRASSPQEAQQILLWASQQPWVSFAQLYPDGTLIHISANIAMFGGDAGVASLTRQTPPSLTPEPEPESEPAVAPIRPPGQSGPF